MLPTVALTWLITEWAGRDELTPPVQGSEAGGAFSSVCEAARVPASGAGLEVNGAVLLPVASVHNALALRHLALILYMR